MLMVMVMLTAEKSVFITFKIWCPTQLKWRKRSFHPCRRNMTDTKNPTLSFCASSLLISQHLIVGFFSPTNRFTSLSADTVEHAPLEAVYIFFDTATYNEIERDVKVTKVTVLAFRFIHGNALKAWQKLTCILAGDNWGTIGSYWRHNGPPHWFLPSQRDWNPLLCAQILHVSHNLQGQSSLCCQEVASLRATRCNKDKKTPILCLHNHSQILKKMHQRCW